MAAESYQLDIVLRSGAKINITIYTLEYVTVLSDLIGDDAIYRFRNANGDIHAVVNMKEVVALSTVTTQKSDTADLQSRMYRAQAKYFEQLTETESWKDIE